MVTTVPPGAAAREGVQVGVSVKGRVVDTLLPLGSTKDTGGLLPTAAAVPVQLTVPTPVGAQVKPGTVVLVPAGIPVQLTVTGSAPFAVLEGLTVQEAGIC